MGSQENNDDLNSAIFAGTEGYDDLDEGPRPDTSETIPEPEQDLSGSEAETPVEEEKGDEEPAGDVEAATDSESEEPSNDEPSTSDDKPKQQPNEPRIPKHRFDEVNERRKAAEARLAKIEKDKTANGGEPEIDFDFNAKEDEYMDAVLDGDKDKAKNVRQEIRNAEKQLYQQQMEQTSVSTREQTKAELDLNTTIQNLQTEYPVFDGQSEQYDSNLTEEALDLFEGFKGRGYDPTTAMNRAVRYVVRANGLEETSAAPADPEPAQPESQHKATPEQGRGKTKRAAKQPPEPTGHTVSEQPDIMNMSEEDFDKLSDQELRKLRGD